MANCCNLSVVRRNGQIEQLEPVSTINDSFDTRSLTKNMIFGKNCQKDMMHPQLPLLISRGFWMRTMLYTLYCLFPKSSMISTHVVPQWLRQEKRPAHSESNLRIRASIFFVNGTKEFLDVVAITGSWTDSNSGWAEKSTILSTIAANQSKLLASRVGASIDYTFGERREKTVFFLKEDCPSMAPHITPVTSAKIQKRDDQPDILFPPGSKNDFLLTEYSFSKFHPLRYCKWNHQENQ